jgi:hypothetical protein
LLEISGDRSAELLDDGSINIEFAYYNGDEAVLKAKRETSSTACQSETEVFSSILPSKKIQLLLSKINLVLAATMIAITPQIRAAFQCW